MYVHNTSFFILRSREEEFLKWFGGVRPELEADNGYNDRLSVLRETGGANDVEAEAQTLAFQLEFADIDMLHDWVTKKMEPVIADFEKSFGPEAAVFTSVFEIL